MTFTLTPSGNGTEVALTNDNNPDEESKKHSEQNWQLTLKSLKELLEP